MKKYLLTAGAILAIATPMVAVISCGKKPHKTASDNDKKQNNESNNNDNTNGKNGSNDDVKKATFTPESILAAKPDDSKKIEPKTTDETSKEVSENNVAEPVEVPKNAEPKTTDETNNTQNSIVGIVSKLTTDQINGMILKLGEPTIWQGIHADKSNKITEALKQLSINDNDSIIDAIVDNKISSSDVKRMMNTFISSDEFIAVMTQNAGKVIDILGKPDYVFEPDKAQAGTTKEPEPDKAQAGTTKEITTFKNGGELMNVGTDHEMRDEIKALLDSSKDDKSKLVEAIASSSFNDDQKAKLTNYVKEYSSLETAWYVMNFIQSVTSESSIRSSKIAIVSGDDALHKLMAAANLTPTGNPGVDSGELYKSVVRSGSLTVDGIAENTINKFKGLDPMFTNMINMAAKFDEASNTLVPGGMWDQARDSMGGDETISYILGHATPHYKLAKPVAAPEPVKTETPKPAAPVTAPVGSNPIAQVVAGLTDAQIDGIILKLGDDEIWKGVHADKTGKSLEALKAQNIQDNESIVDAVVKNKVDNQTIKSLMGTFTASDDFVKVIQANNAKFSGILANNLYSFDKDELDYIANMVKGIFGSDFNTANPISGITVNVGGTIGNGVFRKLLSNDVAKYNDSLTGADLAAYIPGISGVVKLISIDNAAEKAVVEIKFSHNSATNTFQVHLSHSDAVDIKTTDTKITEDTKEQTDVANSKSAPKSSYASVVDGLTDDQIEGMILKLGDDVLWEGIHKDSTNKIMDALNALNIKDNDSIVEAVTKSKITVQNIHDLMGTFVESNDFISVMAANTAKIATIIGDKNYSFEQDELDYVANKVIAVFGNDTKTTKPIDSIQQNVGEVIGNHDFRTLLTGNIDNYADTFSVQDLIAYLPHVKTTVTLKTIDRTTEKATFTILYTNGNATKTFDVNLSFDVANLSDNQIKEDIVLPESWSSNFRPRQSELTKDVITLKPAILNFGYSISSIDYDDSLDDHNATLEVNVKKPNGDAAIEFTKAFAHDARLNQTELEQLLAKFIPSIDGQTLKSHSDISKITENAGDDITPETVMGMVTGSDSKWSVDFNNQELNNASITTTAKLVSIDKTANKSVVEVTFASKAKDGSVLASKVVKVSFDGNYVSPVEALSADKITVKPEFLTGAPLESYLKISDITIADVQGVSVSKVSLKESAYNTKKAVYTVTVSDSNDESKTKDLDVTLEFANVRDIVRISDFKTIDGDKLKALVDDNDADAKAADVISYINSSDMTQTSKDVLNKIIADNANDWKISRSLIRFARGTIGSVGTASMAWNPEGTFSKETGISYSGDAISQFVSYGTLNPKDIISGVAQKAISSPNFNSGLVTIGYNADKDAKSITKGFMWGTAAGAMGGEESISAIAEKAGWTFGLPAKPATTSGIGGFF